MKFKKLKPKIKQVKIFENICYFTALGLMFWTDWRLGLALFLYEKNVCLMILRYTVWRKLDKETNYEEEASDG